MLGMARVHAVGKFQTFISRCFAGIIGFTRGYLSED